MQRRTVLGAVAGVIALSGCGSSGGKHTDEEWNQLLIDALEPLAPAVELTDFSYSMQGVLGRKDSAWISGVVMSDTDADAINEALLDDVGRTIATVHRNNPAKRSRVTVYVLSPSRMSSYKFQDKLDKGVVTIDDLAELYGVDR
ncbi:MAG: hypothetical protein Q4P15_08845 [Propionibacteriaceae bacterium]|nr:hypothetical protein [Propionibacteriaceae bacterium]